MAESGSAELRGEKETLLEKKSNRATNDTTHNSSPVPIILHRSMNSLSSMVVLLITLF